MHEHSRLDAAQKTFGHVIASLSSMKKYVAEYSLRSHVAAELKPVVSL